MFIRIDNNYDSLLSAIVWCLRRNIQPGGIIIGDDCPLLSDCLSVQSEDGISFRIRNKLAATFSQSAAEKIMSNAWLAWLSESDGIAMHIFEYFRTAFIMKYDPTDCISIPAAVAVSQTARKSKRLAHSFLGILRFRNCSADKSSYYIAEFDPDCNVLPLISGHFADRFADQNFIIIDRRRSLAFIYRSDGKCSMGMLDADSDDGSYSYGSMQIPSHSQYSNRAITANTIPDDEISRYWKNYLRHLTIPERSNRNLQKSNLPLKYQKWMTEFQ